MPEIYIDLETLPTLRGDVIEMLAKSIKAPGTYKKPESIAQWMQENIESELDSLVRKTALDGAFGRIFCIGYAIDDEPAEAFSSVSEAENLLSFSEMLKGLDADKYSTLFVGHNITGFDLRFLVQRYIVNNIPVPFLIRYAANAKPWEGDKVFDTMVQWAGVGNRISLDKLCMALNIPTSKDGITGATVYDEWLKENFDGISEYCKKDVEVTRQVFKRMKGIV